MILLVFLIILVILLLLCGSVGFIMTSKQLLKTNKKYNSLMDSKLDINGHKTLHDIKPEYLKNAQSNLDLDYENINIRIAQLQSQYERYIIDLQNQVTDLDTASSVLAGPVLQQVSNLVKSFGDQLAVIHAHLSSLPYKKNMADLQTLQSQVDTLMLSNSKIASLISQLSTDTQSVATLVSHNENAQFFNNFVTHNEMSSFISQGYLQSNYLPQNAVVDLQSSVGSMTGNYANKIQFSVMNDYEHTSDVSKDFAFYLNSKNMNSNFILKGTLSNYVEADALNAYVNHRDLSKYVQYSQYNPMQSELDTKIYNIKSTLAKLPTMYGTTKNVTDISSNIGIINTSIDSIRTNLEHIELNYLNQADFNNATTTFNKKYSIDQGIVTKLVHNFNVLNSELNEIENIYLTRDAASNAFVPQSIFNSTSTQFNDLLSLNEIQSIMDGNYVSLKDYTVLADRFNALPNFCAKYAPYSISNNVCNLTNTPFAFLDLQTNVDTLSNFVFVDLVTNLTGRVGSNSYEFGRHYSGKDQDAGKFMYNNSNDGKHSLDIYGAGMSVGNRLVSINDNLIVGGTLTVKELCINGDCHTELPPGLPGLPGDHGQTGGQGEQGRKGDLGTPEHKPNMNWDSGVSMPANPDQWQINTININNGNLNVDQFWMGTAATNVWNGGTASQLNVLLRSLIFKGPHL